MYTSLAKDLSHKPMSGSIKIDIPISRCLVLKTVALHVHGWQRKGRESLMITSCRADTIHNALQRGFLGSL